MDVKLIKQAMIKFSIGLIAVALLLFVPAGTINYPNAWLFIELLFIPMLIVGTILIFKSSDLLRRRLNSKETQSEQKLVLVISGLMFISGFVIAGLNFAFKWNVMPNFIVAISSIIFLLAYAMYGQCGN